jgi:hypothetical protein
MPPKKIDAAAATAEAPAVPTATSLEDLLAEPTLDGLMTIAKRLADLTHDASIALSIFHHVHNRQGSAVNADDLARLHSMAGACRDFSLAIRNARAIGVHDLKVKAEIMAGLA